ncbi:MAG: restriction endonuclease subunit S [Rickettsia endosymbiont of Cimex lectularius]|nr:MAG: restriction endonuclease subunit S [Rickettsia endosymbiont of Cimex lectularius]
MGKRVLKRDLINIKAGNIPAYSANVFNPVGLIKDSNIKDFDSNFVIWGIDGDFKFNFIRKYIPFATTDHCGTIRILEDTILPQYLMIELDRIKDVYGFDRGLRASLKNMQNIIIRLPVDVDGNLDIDIQQDIIEKYQVISEIKQEVGEYKHKIDKLVIKIDDAIEYCQSVKIEDIFNIKKGIAKYTKTYIKKHKGSYPIYSANTKQGGVLGYINHFDHDVESIQITTNGYAGTVFYRSKHKFSINGDARLYIPKCDNLDCLYLSFELQKVLDKNNFNWEYKPTIERTRNIEIKIPITATDEFDLQKQKEIAEKYQVISGIKQEVEEYKHKIDQLVIKIDNETEYCQSITIDNLFDLSQKTNSSKFTKSFIKKNKGNIPVYSASKDENAINYGYIKDNLKGVKYFEDCLTWNIDGSIGKIFLRLNRFSLSEKVIPLILRDKFKDCNKLYLKYTIENELTTKNFGFANKAGKSKIKNIEIKIPITVTGEFDLLKQKEIAEKYRKIEEIKNNIKRELEKIENIKVDIGL